MITTRQRAKRPPAPSRRVGRFAPVRIDGLEPRPDWWRVRVDEIVQLARDAKRARVETIAQTPAGFPVNAFLYGDFSEPPPASNWSAASASGAVASYYQRPANAVPTVVFCAGVHGAEAEGVAAAANLVALMENGRDFAGNPRPRLARLLAGRCRLVVLPCVNMDGRAISPDHLRGASYEDFRRASQGAWLDGSLIGWRGSKEHFPLPLDRVSYPGGYPNSEGFNIMHDACPGNIRTAEARGILRLAERVRADFVLNAHSCEGEPFMLPPSEINYRRNIERGMRACADVNRALFDAGLRATPESARQGVASATLNLNTLFTLASGALALTLECTVDHGMSFEQLLEVNFVTLETLLESAHDDPFVLRDEAAAGT